MIFNTNLPGNSIQVIDEYNVSAFDSSEFGTTESVLVIGTAFDGPTGKEVAIYNPEHAAYIFGNSYDYKTRKSASLVSYIQDVYRQGCRTIYAMRVGGKELSSIYKLKENIPVYLKISSLFPSNKYKEMSLLIQEGSLTIFKTANKATISEKRNGVVQSSESIISFTTNINDPYAIQPTTKLVDLVNSLNTNVKNNVFSFSLVDAEGADITNSEVAQGVEVSALFDGVYTVGRETLDPQIARLNVQAQINNDKNVYFVLNQNTYMNNLYPYVGTTNDYSFLERLGGIDKISKPDAIDYEEVAMTDFELYKKLGLGYAQTASVYKKPNTEEYVVKPTDQNSPLFSVEVPDGIYSIASNLKADYRVLSCAYADTKIRGKLPSIDAFKNKSAQNIPLLYAADPKVLGATARYKLEDEKIIDYKFVVNVDDAVINTKINVTQSNFTGKIVSFESISLIEEGKYSLVEFANTFWLANRTGILMPLNLLGKDASMLLKVSKTVVNNIEQYCITIDTESGYTINTLVEDLKESPLKNLFDFTAIHKYANESVVDSPTTQAFTVNKKINIDTHIVIPYTTQDNFVRQFAQHVEYTSLKTGQTHGFMGVRPIVNTSLKSVSDQVVALTELNFDLCVKNAVGRPVLGLDNLPYPIGKAVSIICEQHTINTMDAFKYVATGAGIYAGRAATLPKDVSTTNQIVSAAPHFEYSETEKVILNKKGFVTLSYKEGVYKITDGVTQAPIDSQFCRFATHKTIKLVDRVIREAAEPFIGKKNDMANRNALYTAIKSGMEALLNTYLDSYSIKMNYDKFATRLGEINIDYSIDIIDEIRNVKNTVTAKSK